jgi:heterodisulfide reductase subunit D
LTTEGFVVKARERTTELEGLERVKRWLYARDLPERGAGCVLCGSCYGHGPANPMEDEPGFKSKCPPYEFYRFQRFTPKSRWLLAQRVFHGLEPITPELKEVFYTCTTCLMCQEICGVRDDGLGPWDISTAMREEIARREGPLPAHRAILEGLSRYDDPWSRPPEERGRWAEGLGLVRLAERAAPTLLFAGCSADLPEAREGAVALARMLQRAGEDFGILAEEEACCGLWAYDLGFRGEYHRLVRKAIESLRRYGVRRVVVACGSCLRAWKSYPAEALGDVEVLHGSEYVGRLLDEGRLRFAGAIPERIAYHDPCHLGRGCGVYEAPRKVLRAIPGLQLVEMERHRRWSWCCGGGGGVPEAYPEVAEWNARDRLEEARRTGASALVSASALCLRNLSRFGEKRMKLEDLLALAARAL